MFKVFDRKKKQVDLLENPISPVIVNELGGIGELTFSVPSTYKHLELEGYIQVENDHEYVIKEIVTHGTNRDVVCMLNIEEILGMAWSKFISRDNTLMKCAELVLSGTRWRAIDNSSCNVKRNLYGTVTNSYNLLQMMCTVYNVEFIFDTYNKTVTFVDKVGKDAGVYFINDTNLKQLNVDTHTHKYITRVIPIGKDGLTIESVNDGKNYLENKSYSDKNIYGIWQSDKHDDPSALKADAKRFLDEMAIPYETYEVVVDDLYALKGYDEFKYGLGDIVTIIDGDTETRIQQRIIQRTYNLLEPDKDTIHIANKDATFEDYYKRLQTIADMTQSVIGSDGTISGGSISDGTVSGDKLENDSITSDHIQSGSITSTHIKAEQILADHIMSNQITTNHLVANSITSDHIQANSIDTKHLKANTITSDHIQSNTINSNHISANTITSGHIQSGAITAGSGIIADGAIGNAQISKIDAGKIEAGTIDTSKVTIQGANGHLRLKGNRMQVFQGVGNQAKERVSVGDVNGDGTVYGLRVRGADGQTILLDENGVKSEGITNGAITNDKISEDANIDGAKLNINSVVSKINEDGTEVIKGTKIEVDGTNLNAKLSTITNKQTEDSERITQAYSQITANENAINLKVDEQTYTADKKDMTSKLEKATSDISVLKDSIALKVEQTDIENAINEATLSRADFIARNFLSTPLIVSDSTLPIYTSSGIPNPPIGSVFGGFSQERNIIKGNNISSNGSAWAIIVGYEFYKNTTDNDKKNKIRDIIKKVADFMANNVSIGRFNSMDFNFIDTNYKYDSTSKSWVKSNYKEIYISTLWLQVKAMVYAYEILKDNTYSSLCFNILDSLFNTHFYINAKVASNELPTHLEWSSYEYLACDNLSTNYRFVASTKQYANQMGYYIHQAIPDVIRVFGDNERPTPKGDIYKPSDILVGLKKYLKNAYDTQNITAKPLGLPYGYFHRVENESGGYDYIPQNWDFIEDTWGDVWFVGDVVTYTIYAFAASGLTDIAREYADNYYKLRVNVKDDKWSTRFNSSELIFYDRMDFYTGSHLSDDNSISITYTALYYEILKQIGKNEHIDACCYTLAKHQINNLDNKNIDGGYPWDISRDDSSLEFKSFGEIINSQFYKNLNITSFTAIDNKFAEIKVTTDSISQKVSSVETTTTTLDGKVTNQETRLSEAEQKITDKAITSVVQESQFIKDINNKVSSNTSLIEQTANQISSKVSQEDFESYKTQTASEISSKITSKDVSSIIRQSSNDIQIGFNGINDRINVNPTSMDFRATNNNRDMSLYGGQVCIYNNTNDTFMSTVGNVLRADPSYKGVGFLASKHCNTFVIGQDAKWNDIYENRSPNPLSRFFINFESINAQLDGVKGIHLRDITYTTGDLCGIGESRPSIHGFKSISSTSTCFDHWRSLVDNSIVARFDGGTNKILLGKNLNGNGFILENFASVNASKVYLDNVYAYNGNYGKLLFRTNGWDMFNGANWDWQGYNILNPTIIGGSVQTSYALASGYDVDVENDVDILIANEGISDIDENGNVSYDLNEMVKLLYSKMHDLEKEVGSLKQENNELKLLLNKGE